MIQKLYVPLWLFAFLCSLFFFNEYELESFALAALTLFIWGIFSLSLKSDWDIPKSAIIYIFSGFWLLTFISMLLSDILMTSLMAFVFFSLFPLSFFVFSLTATEKKFEDVLHYLALIFGALGVWALAQYFFLSEHFGLRAYHPLKNPNSLAALFNFAFLGAVGALLFTQNKIKNNMLLLLSIIMLGGIIATVSRGAILAMIIVIIPMLFLFRAQVKQHWKCLSLLLMAGISIAALATLVRGEDYEIASRLLQTATSGAGGDTSHRLQLWQATIDMIKNYGFWGTGIGTYFHYFGEFRIPDDRFGTYYAHSDPLQYWVELGILGPILFYSLAIAVLWRTIIAVKKAQDEILKAKTLIPFFILSATFLHAHITFNFYNLSILMMSGLVLAYWFIQTQVILKTDVKTISFPNSYRFSSRLIVVALPVLIIGYFFFSLIISEHLTQRARHHLLAGDLDQFAHAIISAQNVGMGQNYRADLLAVNMPITLLQNTKNVRSEQRQEIFNQGLFYLERAKASNPRSSSVYYYLGLIQEDVPAKIIPPKLEPATEYYRKALSLDPMHFSARIKLSETLSDKEALALLEAGAKFRYSNPAVSSLYAILLKRYAAIGDAKGMAEATRLMQHYQILSTR